MLTLQKEIAVSNLRNGRISEIALSPDGKFLAVETNPELGKAEIKIIDVATGHKTITIPISEYININLDHKPQWFDNNTIFFGTKMRWNVLSGARLPDAPAIGRSPKFDQRRELLFTIEGAIGSPSYFHIYDTRTWSDEKFSADGLTIASASWSADGNIVMSVGVTRETYKKIIDNRTIESSLDRAVRIFDLTKKKFIKSVWFPAKKIVNTGAGDWEQPVDLSLGPTCFKENLILLSVNSLLDAGDLSIHQFYTEQEVKSRKAALVGGYACAASGRYLFIKDAESTNGSHRVSNAVIDLHSKKNIFNFPGGDVGIATDQDEKILAIGGKNKIWIFKIN